MPDSAPQTPTETDVARLRRPALLVRAARIGVAGFRRGRDLARLLGPCAATAPGAALPRLAALEQELETRRRGGLAGYRPSLHVAVLTALIAEARAAGPAGPVT